MNSKLIKIAAATFTLALVAGVSARVSIAQAPATPAPAPAPAPAAAPTTTTPRIHGKVTAVSATSITVHSKKDDTDSTFAITSTTKVKVDKEDSTIDKVLVGMRASIKSDDGKTADEISARSAQAASADAAPKPAN